MKEPLLKLVQGPLQGWRRFSQFVFLVLLNPWAHKLVPGLPDKLMGVCVPVMNCWSCPAAAFACPVGAVGQLLARGVVPVLTIGILLLTGSLLGRLVCGWVCPFGLLQDLMFKIPARWKFRTPHALRWVKYGLLVVMVILIPIFFGVDGTASEASGYFYCKWCPAGTLEASIPVNVQMTIQGQKGVLDLVLGYLASVKFWIFAGFLGAFVVFYRPFCKIGCPIGAFLGLFNKINFFNYGGRGRADCKSCFACSDHCPMVPNVVVSENPAECIACYRCDAPECRGIPVAEQRPVARKAPVGIILDRCKGCGFCIEFCPKDVLTRSDYMNAKGYHPPKLVQTGACMGCDICETVCPEFAIYRNRDVEPGPEAGAPAAKETPARAGGEGTP